MKKVNRIILMLAKAFLTAIILVAVCTYIFFCPPILTRFHGSFLLFPMPPGEEYKCEMVNNIKRDEVFFENDKGNKLNGWFFQAKDPNAPVILFNHGNAGNIGHRLMLVKWLMDAGASVFLYDYREYGKSEGKKDLAGVISDARAAYNYLTETRKIPPQRIIAYGESIGGGPACSLAAAVPVGGLILDSSFTSLLHVGKKKVQFFNIYFDFMKPEPPFENIETIRNSHLPVMIVHGAKDEVIPLSEAKENFAAANEPKTFLLLPESTHNWKEPDANAYIEGVHKFLANIK